MCCECVVIKRDRDVLGEIRDRVEKLMVEKKLYLNPELTLQMLAEEFHLSERYISEYFKEHFSIGFMQYVGHLRMTKAKHLLLDTDLPITEVAFSCGFNSVNLFIRKFKEQYQLTPLQYRKFGNVN